MRKSRVTSSRGLAAAALAVLGTLTAIAACVKGGVVPVHVEPDADATPVEEVGPGLEASASDAACGPAPWVTLGLTVDRFDLGSDGGTPLPGAVFAPSLCPGLQTTSDEAGGILGQISKGVPFTASLTATNYIPELTPEQVFDADSLVNHLEMLPTVFQVLLPQLTPQSTAILVSVELAPVDAGACSQVDGVSFSVSGHPEATVAYFSAGTVPQPVTGASATTTGGLAAITGLASGLVVSPVGTKNGCTVTFQHGNQTGRVAVANGFASLATAVVSP